MFAEVNRALNCFWIDRQEYLTSSDLNCQLGMSVKRLCCVKIDESTGSRRGLLVTRFVPSGPKPKGH